MNEVREHDKQAMKSTHFLPLVQPSPMLVAHWDPVFLISSNNSHVRLRLENDMKKGLIPLSLGGLCQDFTITFFSFFLLFSCKLLELYIVV